MEWTLTKQYVHEEYTDMYFGFSLSAARTIKINMPPDLNGILPDLYQTTFGHRIDTLMPAVTDNEGDEVIITVRDDVNRFLGVYAQEVDSYEVFDGVTEIFYDLRSETLVEGFNAELGTSNVIVTWIDTATNESLEMIMPLEILTIQEY